VKLPESDGLQGDDHNFLGIVVSHPHSDHYGVLTRLIRTGLLPNFPPIISRDRGCFRPPGAVVFPAL
jgi:mRNA degradation ribonuclease J1/J2